MERKATGQNMLQLRSDTNLNQHYRLWSKTAPNTKIAISAGRKNGNKSVRFGFGELLVCVLCVTAEKIRG